jgi:DNA-binding response OmpR family regulator
MAYLKPSWFNRAIFNRIATTFSFGPFETMVVTKRVSKQQQKIPVTPIEVDGVKYLVSATAKRSG